MAIDGTDSDDERDGRAADAPDGPWRRDEPCSPCVKICVIHTESGLCIGCLRSREEIASWPRLSPAEQRAIMATLPARSGRLRGPRRGRAGRRGPKTS